MHFGHSPTSPKELRSYIHIAACHEPLPPSLALPASTPGLSRAFFWVDYGYDRAAKSSLSWIAGRLEAIGHGASR